jgi:hypothetical protein
MEIKNLLKALNEAQPEIQNPTKNRHVIAGAKDYWYSDLNEILELKPILRKHGLLLIQTMRVENGQNIMMTTLAHVPSGEHIESETVLPHDLTPMLLGSAITYYRRYQISAIMCVASEDDLDGDIEESKPKAKPQKQTTEYNDYKSLEVGEIVPSWWWDLMKSDKRKAMSLMPKGCKYEKNAQNKWVVVNKEEEVF